ncbi:hypothetical protein DFP72DRAFT_1076866 [Ephemerocybe angulata]|uniref:Uncharacterized protein n=1 Tax=Ephemerocybe angulata TaxID=980116 RepID=A0A8H6HF77_9AGAR|nr:hypothetical protein DFP72DRAFT_1076866 [Tulosesus angulatus]
MRQTNVILQPNVTYLPFWEHDGRRKSQLSSAEKAVNDRLARRPELDLLALAQFAIAADAEVFSSADCSFVRSGTTAVLALRPPLLADPHDARAAPPALALA